MVAVAAEPPFESHADLLHHARRTPVFLVAMGLDTKNAAICEGRRTDAGQGFGHVAHAPKTAAQDEADLDAMEMHRGPDGSQQDAVFLALDQPHAMTHPQIPGIHHLMKELPRFARAPMGSPIQIASHLGIARIRIEGRLGIVRDGPAQSQSPRLDLFGRKLHCGPIAWAP